MGKAVESIAEERGHRIVVTIDNNDEWTSKRDALQECDMAVDFSMPVTAVENMTRCLEIGLPVVVGTTGWYDQLEQMVSRCKACDGALFVASNFSIGMNIMFELNRRLAQLMNGRTNYEVAISETHHIHKLDAPSGTAITLAKDIVEELPSKDGWVLAEAPGKSREAVPADKVAVTSYREGEVPGIHEVVYDSPVDTIRLSHSAKSRQGLALGAVLAAEFLLGKKGYYTMRDLLGSNER